MLNRFIRLCFWEQELGNFALFGLVLTIRSQNHTLLLFLVPYSMRNVLKKIEICSQPAQLVGELGFFF